jgi:uncharacterized protein
MMAWSLFLLGGVWLGHTVIMVFTMNWVYGCPFPKWVMSPIRKIYALLIVAGCIYVTWQIALLDFDWSRLASESPAWLWVYSALAWLTAFVLYPLTTIRNLRVRRPAVLVSNHTQIVDMTQALGFKPVGHGKRRALAQLPYNQVFEVEFSERTLRLERLPDVWDGLRILHISDLHFCGTPDSVFFREVVERCNAWKADIVAVTGDFVDTKNHHRWIAPIIGRLRYTIAGYAILGNHDAWQDQQMIRRRLSRIGMRVLGNRWERLDVRGQPMTVIGHEGPWFHPTPDLSGCPAGDFRLCLSHTPDNLPWAKRHGIDLVLAGHVHGGQIRLPVFGSIFVPSKFSRRYDQGTFHEGQTVMHVSRGLAGEFPLRINCRPEATLVVLSK